MLYPLTPLVKALPTPPPAPTGASCGWDSSCTGERRLSRVNARWACRRRRCHPALRGWSGWWRPRSASPRRTNCWGRWPECRSTPSRSNAPPKALEREGAADERAVTEAASAPAPTMCLGLDGAGVPVRPSDGRRPPRKAARRHGQDPRGQAGRRPDRRSPRRRRQARTRPRETGNATGKLQCAPPTSAKVRRRARRSRCAAPAANEYSTPLSRLSTVASRTSGSV